jgi:hypothetical protein
MSPASSPEDRIPVIVGVGEITDRPAELTSGLEPLRCDPTSPRKRGELGNRGVNPPYPLTSCFSDTVAGLPLGAATRT